MTFRYLGVFFVLVLVLAGCRREAPADGPDPDATPAADADADAQARADAAAAERAAMERREREEATATARDILERIVYFEFDSERLSAEAQEDMRMKAEILRANPDLRIRVEGHADERGSTEYNLALGQRRAESIRTFLTNFGVSSGQISTLSYGKERPRAQGSNERAWAENRRAEFVVTAGEISTVPSGLR